MAAPVQKPPRKKSGRSLAKQVAEISALNPDQIRRYARMRALEYSHGQALLRLMNNRRDPD